MSYTLFPYLQDPIQFLYKSYSFCFRDGTTIYENHCCSKIRTFPLRGNKGICHIVFNMERPRASTTRQKRFYYDDSDNDKRANFDSGDSVNDKDYLCGEPDSETSSDDNDEVSNKNMWLIPLLRKKNVACIYFRIP